MITAQRLSVWLTAMGLVLTAAANATEEEPWKRVLKGEDAKKATELQKQIDELSEAGKFAEAVKPAKELTQLREPIQGKDHWQTIDARLQLKTLKQIADLPLVMQEAVLKAKRDTVKGNRLNANNKYREADLLFREVVDIYHKLLGEYHPYLATSLNYLAYNLYSQGKYAEAESFFRKALAIRRKILGELHIDTARSANNLALNLNEEAKYTEAELLFRMSVDMHRKLLGEQHANVGTCLSNLAGNLTAQHKFAEAEPLFRQALEIVRNRLGEESVSTALCLNNLAINMNQQARYSEAESLYRRVLNIFRKIRGAEHFDTARSLNNLAYTVDARGKYAEAETFYRSALHIYRKVLGEKHLSTTTCLNNLALNLGKQGNYTEAETLLRQALSQFREGLGEQHPQTIVCINNLAFYLDAQSKYSEAESLYQQVLVIRRELLGEWHSDTALSLNNLAANLSNQGKYAEAEPLYRRGLAIYRKVVGEQSPSTAQCLNNLANNLDAQNKHVEAEILIRQALAIRRKMLGEEHPSTLLSLSNLAFNLSMQGKHREAEAMDRQILAIRRKSLGEQHPDTVLSLSNLASSLYSQGKYSEAEALDRQTLAIRQKTRGEHHPDTALTLNNLAYNLDGQGKYAQSELLYRQALAIRRKVLGEQHPDSLASLNSLASNLIAQGKYADAEPLLRAAAASFAIARLRASDSGFGRAIFGVERSPFSALAACLARLDKPADAWQAVESGLARGLLDDLALPVKPDSRQRTRAVRLAELDYLLLPLLTTKELKDADKNRLAELSKERDALQAELTREAAELSRREVYSLERIQKQLPADNALIFWIDISAALKAADPNDDHWGCVIRRTGTPAWFRLPGSGDKDAWTDADTRLPDRLHRSLANGESDWEGLAHRLARQRLAPLESALGAHGDLPAARRLIVAPAGWMASVPLEALTNRYTISYAPSGTMYARLCEQHRSLSEPSLLALGDPAFTVPAAPPPTSPPDHGLLLTSVQPGSNAAKGGLRSGDVLLRYGDHKLTAFADLKLTDSGDPVLAKVWRDGKTLDLRLSPGKLGAAIHRDPAPVALHQQRELDAALTVTRGEWKPLPGSRREVKAIQALFPKATVLLGSEASEQRLDELAAAKRLQDFRVLHLATHGQVDATSAARSALLLARDQLPDVNEQARLGRKIYNGRLTVAAIASTWQLDADLVALSACETALGPQGGGDGLLGFSQILFQKGARALLLSLWEVEDTATALLMQRFYENWLGKRKDLKVPLPKAEALREAKEWLRHLRSDERDRLASGLRGQEVPAKPVVRTTKEATDKPYAHPRYWAAFILIGDPE